MKNQVTTLSIKDEGFSFLPRTFEEAERYATLIANSAICPSSFKGRPGDVLVILQMGHELKLKPMQALRTLGCINGIPFVYGDGLLALVKRHPDFLDIKEWIEGDMSSKNLSAHCTVSRRGQTAQTRTFSLQDAETAGLLSKPGPWKQYLKRMLQHRARSFACRDVFPDALFGLISEEEAVSVPATHIVPSGKGIQALKSSLGLIVNQDDPEKVITHSRDDLKKLISDLKITDQSISVTLKKFNANSIDDLTNEQIEKWHLHLMKKTKGNSNAIYTVVV